MNLGPGEAVALVKKLDQRIESHRDVEVVVCPPLIDLVPVYQELDHRKFKLGAQNCYYLDEGAVTGEVSATMLRGLAEYVIIGHSERRQLFGETDKLISQKMAAVVRNGLKPVLCVGENLSEREHNLSTKVVVDQLTADLSLLTADDMQELVVAYEPVWAIGTGKFATPDQIMPVVKAIRSTVEELYGESAHGGLRVLYGGSVNPDNAAAYLSQEGIDGLLPGGASLHYEQFGRIVETAHRA